MKTRERLSGRVGFILVSLGCAIGMGNIWRFPYITGQYGGAIFVLMYIIFLFMLGLPIIIMEFAIGRGGQKNLVSSYKVLEKPTQKWHYAGYVQILGNFLLLAFYTVVAGWCLAYFFDMLMGNLEGLSTEAVGAYFGATLENQPRLILWTAIVIIVCSIICAIGLENGVEKSNKIMMSALFAILIILVVRSVTLDGAIEGIKFYLVPDFKKFFGSGISHFANVTYAALGQAFFTLSIGMGNMAIFGSYIDKKNRLTGEAIVIVILDTFIALLAGLIIFPASFAFNVNPGQGAGLAFVTLPNIFNFMPMSRLWGSLFFMFLSFAALSTVIGVIENIFAFFMDEYHVKRKRISAIIAVVLFAISIPTILGFSALKNFNPLGEGTVVLDLLDFIVSNNIMPIGGVVILLFCTRQRGWGWKSFISEVNSGAGVKFPTIAKFYISFILPLIILIIFVGKYIDLFFK